MFNFSGSGRVWHSCGAPAPVAAGCYVAGILRARSPSARTVAIFTAGYKAVLHIHSVVEECEIVELIEKIDMKRKKESDPKKKNQRGMVLWLFAALRSMT